MLPFRRRRDAWSSPHERAHDHAARRLDGWLDPAEAAWLETHVAACRSCRALVDAYEADRLELRALRRDSIEPPRDLWARTAAAVEREAASRGATRSRERRSSSILPLGALSGALVVAVVISASLLATPPPPRPPATGGPVALASPSMTPVVSRTPEPTRMAVDADVGWLSAGPGGKLEINQAVVSEVCADDSSDCAPIPDPSPGTIDLSEAPKDVLISPDEDHLVVVEGEGTDGNGVLVLPAPGASPLPTPSASLLPTPSASSPSPSPARPTASPSLPAASSSPTAPPSTEPTGSPDPSPTPTGTPSPTSEVSPSVEPSPSAPAGAIRIASNVVVVGATAAFSRDGHRFAFSARPADGSTGPDIFVWTVGDPEATRVTDDHRSVFGGWADGLVVGSRPVDPVASSGSPDPSAPSSTARPDEYAPETFLIDPVTGTETVISGTAGWRPSVDPTGARAVYWDGTIELATNAVDWQPASGRLVVGPWSGADVAQPVASGAAAPTASTPPVPGGQRGEVEVLGDTGIAAWDARWDETGEHLAVWIADADDPATGWLSLYSVDRRTGRIDVRGAPLRNQRALPGFAVGENRLVWATPRGQDAKGSHIKVLAWTDGGFGQVETTPEDEAVLVIR